MANNKFHPNFLINALKHSAFSFFATAKLLEKDKTNFDSILLPYLLITSTALELFAKLRLLQAYLSSNMPLPEIESKFRSFGHELHILYSKEVMGSEFLSAVGVTDVKKIKESGVYCYDFFLQSKDSPVRLYNPESLKYWMLSSSRSNSAVFAFQTQQILELCESVKCNINFLLKI